MATLFLIRHAEPVLKGVFLGQLDPPLSAAGRQQAARTLSEIEVCVTYSSPLQRARETASLIRSPQRIEVPGLREIDYGEWTGKSWVEIQLFWKELAADKCVDWLGVTVPGAEAWPDFVDRVRAAWQIIRTGHAPAAVVAHQGVNAALAHLITAQDPLGFMQQHGEVIRVQYD